MSEELKLSDLEKREIKLEAIVQAIYEAHQKYSEQISFTTVNLRFFDECIDALYNEAEIRVGIEDYIEIKIEMNQETKEKG